MIARVTDAGPGSKALWFGFLGAPLAWSLQLLVAYALVSVPCGAPRADEPTVALAAAISASVAALAVAGGALWTAVRNLRMASAEESGPDVLSRAVRERVSFMAISGIFVGVVFTIGLLFAMAGLFVLDPCG